MEELEQSASRFILSISITQLAAAETMFAQVAAPASKNIWFCHLDTFMAIKDISLGHEWKSDNSEDSVEEKREQCLQKIWMDF